jgi:hypothetical protein
MTKSQITKSKWGRKFQKECPTAWDYALRYAADTNLTFHIIEATENDYLERLIENARFAIIPCTHPTFWMATTRTEKTAVKLCKEMGWKLETNQQ